MKWIDLPPVWLCGALCGAYWTSSLVTIGPSFDHPLVHVVALVLIAAGIVLMGLAAFEMRRHKTTLIPHLDADRLVRSGIFAWSRNPIYLGDVLVLAGFVLRWDSVPALLLVCVFIWVLHTRFILPEEGRLAAKFGSAFDDYTVNTRRWL